MTSFLGNVAALAATGQIGQIGMPAPTLTRDPTWLQVEVCREYLRQACKRDNTECKYAHPSSNVDIQNGKVTVCFDAFKDRCTRSNCKYFHAPAQMKADLEMRGKMSLMRQKSEQLALQNHHQSSAAHAVAQAAAQLALIHQIQIQQQQQHNPQAAAQLAAAAALHNPFIQNVPPVFPNSAAATNTAIVQYHQILQQNYGVGAGAGPNGGAAPGNPAGTMHPPVTVSSPPSNGIGGLSPPNGFFDPNTLALAANAMGVVNGTNGGPHLSSAGSSPSPPKVLSTIEVCREFSRGACPRSEDDCRFAHVHPDSNVAIDSVENRVTVCMDYVKNGGICQRQASQDKCKYFHPPQHLQEKFKSINNNNNNVNNNNNNINNNSISVAPLNQQQLQSVAANPMLSPQTPAAVFTFQSPLNLQQSYANTSSLIPNYGKVLRLDSATGAGAVAPGGTCNKLPPTPVTPAGTSPIGAAALNPFNHFSNPGAPPPTCNPGQPPASPHQTAAAFFYTTPMYAAHLSAAQAAAAAAAQANSNQSAAAAAAAALLPSANSPAFLASQGATLMNGSPSSAALFANSGRYAAF